MSAGGLGHRSLDGLRQLGFGLAIWAGYLLITHAVPVGVGSADAPVRPAAAVVDASPRGLSRQLGG